MFLSTCQFVTVKPLDLVNYKVYAHYVQQSLQQLAGTAAKQSWLAVLTRILADGGHGAADGGVGVRQGV